MRRTTFLSVAGPALMIVLLAGGCEREQRRFTEGPPAAATAAGVSLSELHPGGQQPPQAMRSPYLENAWAISEGKRLFDAMNCTGCHAHGSGGTGPALMDHRWIYGFWPENIHATIVEGRPNGMPSFRGRLTEQQVWQLVAYVRSLSGLVPKDAAGGRSDHMAGKPAEQSTTEAQPVWTGAVP
jgi:cytochrome c oxidase cbb3-type subunit 3